MVILSNLRHVNLGSTRLLHASCCRQAASESTKRKPTVTKKKFSELPNGRTRNDGSTVIPLGEWSGGLESTGTARSCDKSLVHDVNAQPIASDVLVPSRMLPVKTRRKRVNKVISVIDAISDSAEPALVKTRKKRVKRDATVTTHTYTDLEGAVASVGAAKQPKTNDISEESTSVLGNQPRNQLATEILGNLARFPHCILLTRVGQFYESYFDQAAEVSKLLNIKLTQRVWDGHRILMCGFPVMHLDKYLKILVQQNRRFVAMCQEYMCNPSLGAKGGIDRRVSRVITPGTLIDEPFINEYENNYIMAIDSSLLDLSDAFAQHIALAWMDVSTGEFFARTCSLEALRDELTRISPREIVLDQRLKRLLDHPIVQTLNDEDYLISYTALLDVQALKKDLVSKTGTNDLTVTPSDAEVLQPPPFTPHETSAIQLLMSYLRENLLDHMPSITSPQREDFHHRMEIDSHTIKALEINQGMREGGTTGSLLSVVRRTVTSSGTRLLSRWLRSPSTSVTEINARQNLVAFMHARPHLRVDLAEMVKNTADVERIVQKFQLGCGHTDDVAAVSNSITNWTTILDRIKLEKFMEGKETLLVREDWASVDALTNRMHDLSALAKRISLALRNSTINQFQRLDEADDGVVETPIPQLPNDLHKWTIRPEFSDKLTSLHQILDKLLRSRENQEKELQMNFDAPSLTLRFSPGHGMHVHVGRAKRDQTKIKACNDFASIAQSGSTSTFFYQPWSQLGNEIRDTAASIVAAEKEAFQILRDEINALSNQLRFNARILDELDATIGFANLAAELNFARPTVINDLSYHVVNGRHPTVERGLLKATRTFTPNDVIFSPQSQLHIITGPNMAGKSTFLRQTALIAILAQTGSFVPADHATLGIVDKVFSRVGAKDDLFRDRSTFMVEMLETSEILRKATPRSLVIMDEVGRGTTVKDGLAIAFATVHHLITVNKCRALFATHFHELSHMLGYDGTHRGQGIFRNASFFCTDVDETKDGHFAYSYRLQPGVNRDSHGLKVAQLAGLPMPALNVARRALERLKASENLDHQDLQLLGQSLADQSVIPQN